MELIKSAITSRAWRRSLAGAYLMPLLWRRKIRVGQDETGKRAVSGLPRLADRREPWFMLGLESRPANRESAGRKLSADGQRVPKFYIHLLDHLQTVLKHVAI